VRTAVVGPLTGLIAQLGLLAALAATVGLGAASWVVGIACAVAVTAALARGLARSGAERVGAATWVTLARATLAVGVAALVADSFAEPAPVALLVALTAVALALDAVDGQVARRTDTTSALGARLDGEVDAFLIAVLSVYVAAAIGVWVLAIGAARYVFGAAGWLLPWLRAPLPARTWRRVVAATQGIVLVTAAADVLPTGLTRLALVAALLVLAESFGRDAWWLWRHREAVETTPGRLRVVLAWLLTGLAGIVVWAALVAPNRISEFTPGAFVRLPLEGLVAIALAVVLPVTLRRVLAVIAGLVLGAVVLLALLDIGFREGFDRPFNPVDDWFYAGIGIETLREAVGPTEANLVIAGAVGLLVLLLVVPPLAMLRVTRVAADHRRRSLQLLTGLGVVWIAFWLLGVHIVPGAPVAATSAANIAGREVQAFRAGLEGRAEFGREIARDPFRDTAADRILTGLRGKDVLLVFVESYGRVALEHPAIAPPITAVLDRGQRRLQARGFASRSGYLTSSTYGGISWLAHATLQAGVWVDGQRRYDQLVTSGRLTLSKAFKRAGWRTVGVVPAHTRNWPEGSLLYDHDRVYDQRNLGYRGPTFAYASMPDQYTLLALQRLELSKRPRPAVFAEVDLVSSHTPWTRIPSLIDWADVGDGSVFRGMPAGTAVATELWKDPARVRQAYGRSIEYSLDTVLSFLERYGGDDLVVLMLGDHQPSSNVSGRGATHDVPISIITRDPAVFAQIADWEFEDGLRPGPAAPVWPMDAFRDRFLGAFSGDLGG
jgi:phosphatidylglycerophosphate synthase